MSLFWSALGVVIFAVISSLLVWLLIVLFKEKKLPQDDIYFHNYLSQYAEGHSRGKVLDIIKGDKRTGVVFMPTDYNKVKLQNTSTKILQKSYIVWFENRKLLSFSRGEIGTHVHEMIGLPPTAEDLPYQFKNTILGKTLMELIEKENAQEEEVNILRRRIQNQNKLVTKTESLDLVDDFGNKITEVMKDLTKIVNPEKKSSPYIGGQTNT